MGKWLVLILLLVGVPAWATTYYVDAGCGNVASYLPATRACTGGSATSRTTIGGGIALLSAGDTLYIRQGTYAAAIRTSTTSIPSGTSWSNAVTIAGYPNETVTLTGDGLAWIDLSAGAGVSYVIFDRLVLAGPGGGDINAPQVGLYVGSGNHHIRLSNSEIKNIQSMGVSGHGDYLEVINCSIHNNYNYGFYWGGTNSIFDRNRLYNHGGYDFHIYNQSHNDVSGNIIRNNGTYGSGGTYQQTGQQGTYGIILSSGSNNIAYNNIVRDHIGGGGIQIAYTNGGTNNQVYSNTIYANSGDGIDIFDSAPGTVVRNNIVYGNVGTIGDYGAGTVQSNNLFDDPGFVSVSGATPDFHIAVSGSPAVNAGATLGAPYNIDLEGLTRPAGQYTVGAYQFTSGPVAVPLGNVAKFSFDIGSGTTAVDSSGQGHICTLTSAGWASPGIIGPSSFSLNGARSCQISPVTGLTTPMVAVSLWLKGTVLPPSGHACFYTVGDSIQLCLDGTGRPVFTVITDTYRTITGPTVVQNGVVHHLAASYSTTDGQRLWLDGAQVAFATATGPITYPFGTLTQIGRYFTDNIYAYTGVMDQVDIFDDALTQAGVNALFAAAVTPAGVSQTHQRFSVANLPEGNWIGIEDTDQAVLVTTPWGVRWSLHNATGGPVTENFRPFCRVNHLGVWGAWTELTNSFGSFGLRYLTDSAVNLGSPTTRLLPLDGFTGVPGKYLADVVDLTSPYDAAQKITFANGEHAELEIRMQAGSPVVAGDLVQCKPYHESGVVLSGGYGTADVNVKTMTLQAIGAPATVRLGGTTHGGTSQ